MVEHDHVVRRHRVRHAMRDHDHGFAAVGEIPNGLQDQRLAFHVHTAGGFVEYVDRAASQQCAGDCDALTLPSGKIRRILLDMQVEPLRIGMHEIGYAGRIERPPQVFVGGVRAGHEQVLTQRSGEKVASCADHGQVPSERIQGESVQFTYDAASPDRQCHRSFISGERADDDFRSRCFSGSRLPHDRGETSRFGREGCVFHRAYFRIGVVSERDVAQRDRDSAAVCGQDGRSPFRLTHVKQCENAFRRGHAVHRDMKEGAELTQRNEEVGGQQHDQQHSGNRQHANIRESQERRKSGCRIRSADRILPYGHADAGRGTSVRHDVHRGKRAQLDLQHVHGHRAETLGFFVHLPGRTLVRIEGFQRFQPLQVVEERGSHVGVFAPILFEYACGAHGHESDDQHDERRADEQRHGRRHVDRCHHEEQGHGSQHRVEQLRQEQFEEALYLFDALASGLHHVGGAGPLGI